MSLLKSNQIILAALPLLFLSACGGGSSGSSGGSGGSTGGGNSGGGSEGGGATSTISFQSSDRISVAENTQGTIYTAKATAASNDPVSISIKSGFDADFFEIDASGNLRFRENPNYDMRADEDHNNIYQVWLTATAGSASADFRLLIDLKNIVEGVSVTRIAQTGGEPVAITIGATTDEAHILDKSGRVVDLDTRSGAFTQNAFVAANIRSGEGKALAYADFEDNSGTTYSRGLIVLTHSATEGLALQGFNADQGDTWFRKLDAPYGGPFLASMYFDFEQHIGGFEDHVLIAVGDPFGQKVATETSAYGKILKLTRYRPYTGPSQAFGLQFSYSFAGKGVRNPGGVGIDFFGRSFLADRGANQHELNFFNAAATPFDFGWPTWEGGLLNVADQPLPKNRHMLTYANGNRIGQQNHGEGIVAGHKNLGIREGKVGAVEDAFIFADIDGRIFALPGYLIGNGKATNLYGAENRTEDFTPDAGAIDSPVGFATLGKESFLILDRDGEVFKVVTGL